MNELYLSLITWEVVTQTNLTNLTGFLPLIASIFKAGDPIYTQKTNQGQSEKIRKISVAVEFA